MEKKYLVEWNAVAYDNKGELAVSAKQLFQCEYDKLVEKVNNAAERTFDGAYDVNDLYLENSKGEFPGVQISIDKVTELLNV